MDFTKLKTLSILKITGLALLVIIILAGAFSMIRQTFNSAFNRPEASTISFQKGSVSYDYAEDSLSAAKYGSAGVNTVGLSIRNAESILPPIYGGTTGDQAEAFEVTDYSATIETRRLDNTCQAVAGLKAREEVIFENASEYDRGCNYVFKVKKDKVAEILAIIEELNPKELSENSYTIKKLVDDYTSESEILKKKLASIDETLEKAVSAYDEVTELATRVQNVESLAKIIDSKVNIIERLTQERININSQLEALERSKADQLDRLEYTYFRVNIFESKFIDAENLKDSWKTAVKDFVRTVNKVFQDISINLVALLFLILQYAIYLLILLFIAKYGWQLVKHIWKR